VGSNPTLSAKEPRSRPTTAIVASRPTRLLRCHRATLRDPERAARHGQSVAARSRRRAGFPPPSISFSSCEV